MFWVCCKLLVYIITPPKKESHPRLYAKDRPKYQVTSWIRP